MLAETAGDEPVQIRDQAILRFQSWAEVYQMLRAKAEASRGTVTVAPQGAPGTAWPHTTSRDAFAVAPWCSTPRSTSMRPAPRSRAGSSSRIAAGSGLDVAEHAMHDLPPARVHQAMVRVARAAAEVGELIAPVVCRKASSGKREASPRLVVARRTPRWITGRATMSPLWAPRLCGSWSSGWRAGSTPASSRSSTSCARRTASSASNSAGGACGSPMTSGDAWPSRAGPSVVAGSVSSPA